MALHLKTQISSWPHGGISVLQDMLRVIVPSSQDRSHCFNTSLAALGDCHVLIQMPAAGLHAPSHTILALSTRAFWGPGSFQIRAQRP